MSTNFAAYGSFTSSTANKERFAQISKSLAEKGRKVTTGANPGSDPCRLAYREVAPDLCHIELPWMGAFAMTVNRKNPTEKAYAIVKEIDPHLDTVEKMLHACCVHILLGPDCTSYPDFFLVNSNPAGVGRTDFMINLAYSKSIDVIDIRCSSSVEELLSTIDVLNQL